MKLKTKKDEYLLIPNVSKEEVKCKFAQLNIECDGEKVKLYSKFCECYDLYFNIGLIDNAKSMEDYLRMISSLSQYRGLKYKNSVFTTLGEEKEKHCHEFNTNLSLLETLEQEERMLLSKIQKAREEDNIGTYKNLILALKEIMHLKSNINEEERIVEKVLALDLKENDKIILMPKLDKDNSRLAPASFYNGMCESLQKLTNRKVMILPYVESLIVVNDSEINK